MCDTTKQKARDGRDIKSDQLQSTGEKNPSKATREPDTKLNTNHSVHGKRGNEFKRQLQDEAIVQRGWRQWWTRPKLTTGLLSLLAHCRHLTRPGATDTQNGEPNVSIQSTGSYLSYCDHQTRRDCMPSPWGPLWGDILKLANRCPSHCRNTQIYENSHKYERDTACFCVGTFQWMSMFSLCHCCIKA